MELNNDAVLLAVDEKADSYKFYDNSDKLDHRLKVIAMSDLPEYQQDVKFVSNKGLAPGMLFGKHPYLSNVYLDLDTYEDEIFKYTQLKLREIAFFLGAKKISFSVKVLETKKGDKNLHLKGNFKGGKGVFDATIQEEQKLTNQYSKTMNFTGETDDNSYQKAKDLAQESGLDKLEDVEELLMYHNPNTPNMETSRNVKIEISSEFNSCLDVAATVDYLKIFSVRAEYEEKFKIYNKYIYEAYFEW